MLINSSVANGKTVQHLQTLISLSALYTYFPFLREDTLKRKEIF